MGVKFTNKHNLPESFVNAVLVDDHVVAGDISVTQLIDSPQIRQLRRSTQIEMDVVDLVTMKLGTGFHSVMEEGDIKGSVQSKTLQKAAAVLKALGEEKASNYMFKVIEEKLKEQINDDIITEQTLTMEVNGYIISGTFDRFTKSIGLLEDYKTTSASSVMFPETKSSWDAQLNIYACLLRENGYDIKAARIIAILKDWSKMKTFNAGYPKIPVVMHDIPLLEHDRVMKYIAKRVELHQRADAGETIPCSPKDRWAKADTYAVKQEGGKKALRILETPELAQAFIDENHFKYKKPLEVEFRQSESFRCKNGYCAVADICPQFKEEKEKSVKDAENM